MGGVFEVIVERHWLFLPNLLKSTFSDNILTEHIWPTAGAWTSCSHVATGS